jgi:hypothetical protein
VLWQVKWLWSSQGVGPGPRKWTGAANSPAPVQFRGVRAGCVPRRFSVVAGQPVVSVFDGAGPSPESDRRDGNAHAGPYMGTDTRGPDRNRRPGLGQRRHAGLGAERGGLSPETCKSALDWGLSAAEFQV